MIRVLRHTASA